MSSVLAAANARDAAPAFLRAMIARLAGALRKAAEEGDAQRLSDALSAAERDAPAGKLQLVLDAEDPETDLTALMLAAAGGHAECCELLLGARADANATAEDAGGRSALHLAAYSAHVDVVQLLVGARADVGARCRVGEFGGTARDMAAQRAKEWRIGGGDGEEDVEALDRIVELLDGS